MKVKIEEVSSSGTSLWCNILVKRRYEILDTVQSGVVIIEQTVDFVILSTEGKWDQYVPQ